MPLYNLIEYNSNYSETTGNLWFYSKVEANNFNAVIANDNNFKSFECKAKLVGNTVAQPNWNEANGISRNATITVPLKYLSNFRRSIKVSLINCKVELNLKWTKHCFLSAAASDNVNNIDSNSIIYCQRHKFISSSCKFIRKRQSETIKKSWQRIWKIILMEWL